LKNIIVKVVEIRTNWIDHNNINNEEEVVLFAGNQVSLFANIPVVNDQHNDDVNYIQQQVGGRIEMMSENLKNQAIHIDL
jgi:hypothetical protein